MEYTIGKLANLAGITTRTLRFYDQINLLKPSKLRSNGYRIYTEAEVDKLQQILFFRVLQISPETIKNILDFPGYDAIKALEEHSRKLMEQKEMLDTLINNANRTISKIKGDIEMADKDKFDGFKKKLLQENEKAYGDELRVKYGEKTIKESNNKFAELTQEQYKRTEEIATQFSKALIEAALLGDPSSQMAKETCRLHKEWLVYFWNSDIFTPQAHLGLAQMYCDDSRFGENMQALTCGRAEFFKNALKCYYDSL